MSLDLDKENMTIMGVAFEISLVFKSVWYILGANVIEGCNLQLAMLKNCEMRLLHQGQLNET